MKQKTKDYIKGFKHGARWANMYIYTQIQSRNFELEKALKEAAQSLREMDEG